MESEYAVYAKEAYLAYGQTTDFKNYQGLPMPRWEDLTPRIKEAWIAAATRVADLVVSTNGK